MATRNSASLAHFSLCGGSYFLGVATALGLVYFDALPDDWKFRVTVAVAVMAAVLLSAGVVVREPRVGVRVCSRGHTSAASRGTTQMAADCAAPTAGGPTVAFEAGTAMGAAPRGPSHPDRGDGIDARIPAGIRRAADACNDAPAAQSATGGPTHDLAPPERSGSVAGVEPEQGPVAELQAADLIGAWDAYRRTGDGHFNPRGLQRVLDDRGIGATVSGGDRIGLGGSVLIIETQARQAHFYVLPSFAKSPRAVADWFDDSSGGALTGRTERVIQVAEGCWTGSGFDVVRRGGVA